MAFQLLIRPRAETDLLCAYRFYESRELGLGVELVRCVEAKIELISREPELFPVKYRGMRRSLVDRFPFGIYYLFDGSLISVATILDLRQDPKKIRARLEKEG